MLEWLAFENGIPFEVKGLKPLCWKILLGYLPLNRSKWKATIENSKRDYEYYIN